MIKKTISLLQEFSIPLIAGVVVALFWANQNYEGYHHFIDAPLFGGPMIFGHQLTFHFLMNDIFMVLFFGIAGVEITQAALPGGSLNPISRAVNPLLGTLGGVLGPVGVFFLLGYTLDLSSLIGGDITLGTILNGWGVPTATDIALAWLVARLVFGASHPAVSYLLLLAVADDAIGLGIIAVFYPDPNHPVEIQWLFLTLLGMAVSFGLRKMDVKNFWPYLLIGGGLSWCGLILAYLHPALALVFIVPFMPANKGDHGELFEDEPDLEHAPLTEFEHKFKLPVDLGLFGFGLANAGVLFAGINSVTWMILAALLVGKTVGITFFGMLGNVLGSKLPDGMNVKTLALAGLIAGLGLTVALFVSGEAYTDPGLQGAAKMGALLSAIAAPLAIILGIVLKVQKKN